MLISSPARMWLGSAALAGLFLACSLTASASTPTAPIRTSLKSIQVASNIVPTATYTKAVRKELKWTALPVITNKVNTTAPDQSDPNSTDSNLVAVASVQPTTKQSTKAVPAAKTSTKPVQVAKTSPKQVSRSDSSRLVNNALSLVGVPYVYGGTSRKGFDCSGYTQYVFKGSSVSLPRTSQEQFNVGSSVSRKQLQSGDLVFFHTYASGASHVGIYIGEGRFVHASNSGVSVSSLNESYYAGRYLGARRAK